MFKIYVPDFLDDDLSQISPEELKSAIEKSVSAFRRTQERQIFGTTARFTESKHRSMDSPLVDSNGFRIFARVRYGLAPVFENRYLIISGGLCDFSPRTAPDELDTELECWSDDETVLED